MNFITAKWQVYAFIYFTNVDITQFATRIFKKMYWDTNNYIVSLRFSIH